MNIKHEYLRKSDKSGSVDYRGGLAVGLMIGVGIGIFLTIGLEAFLGENPLGEPSILIGVTATLAALTSSFLALLALTEQRRTRQAGTDPVLIAHFSQREDARELIILSISNVGAGAAMNVHLSVDADFDPKNFKILTDVFSRHEPFRSIPQNTSIGFNFGLGFELLSENTLPPFTVSLEYWDINGGRYTGSFQLNIREMEKRGSERSLRHRQALATESISKDFNDASGKLNEIVAELSTINSNLHEWRNKR